MGLWDIIAPPARNGRNNIKDLTFPDTGVGMRPRKGVSLVEDFLAPSGTTLPAWLATVESSPAGAACTGAYVDDTANGVYALATNSTSEVQSSILYGGDNLIIDITKKPIFEARLLIDPHSTDTALAAGDEWVCGLCDTISAATVTLNDVALNVWFYGVGANNNILVEADDGTTDTDDTDTGADWTAATYMDLRIDCTNLSSIKFFKNGSNITPAAGISIAAATGNVQPFIALRKAASTKVHALKVDYIAAWWDRS